MYLKEVVINGFKSFADRTVLQLDRGVTTIVGPNGCGKSNIVDCIRWVLGEQSAKALRGGKMQDVIFEGTDRRKPLPQCEVFLRFTDCEQQLGTEFNEVEIGRRVSREGSSDYFINGKACRLKDIQRLFMDTGVGRVSYSFMVQGQIDQILSSNPAERRTIFEEAAGITRYKSQRREALNKLALVDQNLARVSDVMEEVGRQIGSLKRQAGKALRYKRLKHRLTHLDLAQLAHQRAQRGQCIEEFSAKEDQLRKRLESAQAALLADEAEAERLKTQRNTAAEARQQAQQGVFDLRSQKENAEGQAEMARVRAEDLRERITQLEDEQADLSKQQAALRLREQDQAASKEAQQALVNASDDAFREREDDLRAADTRLQAAEKALRDQRQAQLIADGSLTRARSRCTSLELDLKTLEVRHAGLKEQMAQLESGLEQARAAGDAQTKALDYAQSDVAEADAALAQAREAEEAQRIRFRAHQETIAEADREVARLGARLATLEDLQARFEGFTDGAKAILQGKLDSDCLPGGLARALGQHLKIEGPWGDAVEALLGMAAGAVSLDSLERAQSVTQALAEQKHGRAVLQFPAPGEATEETSATPAGIIGASEQVQARDAELQPAVERLLDGCFFGDSLETILTTWQANPQWRFRLAAAQDGTVVDGRGLIYTSGGTRSKDGSFIQRAEAIRQGKAQIETANERLTELTDTIRTLEAELEAAGQAVETARARLGQTRETLSAAQAEARQVTQRLEHLQAELNKARAENERIDVQRQEANAEVEKSRAAMVEAEARSELIRSEIAAGEEALASLRGQVEARREALAEVRLDLAEKRQRLLLLDRGISEAQEQLGDLEQRTHRRALEQDSLLEQIAELETEAARETNKASQLDETLSVTRASLENHHGEVQALEGRLGALEQALNAKRSAQRSEEHALNETSLALATERSQCAFLDEKAQGDYGLELSGVDWKQFLWQADETIQTRVNLDELDDGASIDALPTKDRGEPTEADLNALEQTDWPAIEAEVKDLRQRVLSLGEVNPSAIEEYQELKQRHDFLKNQSEDLWKSKEELLAAIEEINTTSQQLFEDTFRQVRENFQFTFKQLFGGGEADLQLIAAEDVLDSGIDIIARPPGTKLKNLSLLSGGQKTMTAVALLFAIYMVKPSPFCVLDELDAPLDDANIGRFIEMLRQFTRYSQFLVITHSKRTIAAADTIYGVTMEERGVTRMISMRFDRTRGEAVSRLDSNEEATQAEQPVEAGG
ncbi:MAG: chromosome segregation protein SMC [Opitutales bacterium]